MSDFTSVFFQNMVNSSSSICQGSTGSSLNSMLPSTTTLNGSSTTSTGSQTLNLNIEDRDDVDFSIDLVDSLESTIGSAVISTGTTVTVNANDIYKETKEQLELTQAYVESLDGKELEELITKLESKEVALCSQEHEQVKTLKLK